MQADAAIQKQKGGETFSPPLLTFLLFCLGLAQSEALRSPDFAASLVAGLRPAPAVELSTVNC
jgi:hypothetical protein